MADLRTEGGLLELGLSGLRHYAGHVREEFLADLSGARGARVYREMRDNDPVVGAVLFAIEMLLRGVAWRVEPAANGAADRAAADFVRQALDDMDHGFEETLSEALSFLTYGWALFEIVYKRRKIADSRFADGAVGWRKFAIRAQDSLSRWCFGVNRR
jgi:phage gp29-like protein